MFDTFIELPKEMKPYCHLFPNSLDQHWRHAGFHFYFLMTAISHILSGYAKEEIEPLNSLICLVFEKIKKHFQKKLVISYAIKFTE
jgi:hypothetical protein